MEQSLVPQERAREIPREELPDVLAACTTKQRRFAEFYALHNNGAKSARLAGYAVASSGGTVVNGLMHNEKVIEAIAYYRELHADASTMSPEKILVAWARMATVDVSEFVTDDWELRPKSQLTKEQRASLVGLEVIEKKEGRTIKPKFARVEALKELGKLLQMYKTDSTDGKSGLDLTINLGTQVIINKDGEGEEMAQEIGHLRINKAPRS